LRFVRTPFVASYEFGGQ